MEKKCGCKGCRTCLQCEGFVEKRSHSHIDKSPVQTFYYCHHLGQCFHQLVEKDHSLNNKSKQQQTNFIGFKFPGVEIIPNFIAQDEEAELVDNIDKNSWKNSQSGRKKQDYGPKVNFKKQKLKLSTFNGLPFYISEVVTKINQLSFLKDFYIVEQCNLEYVPERGSQIEPHFDDNWLWGERLVTLNMLSDTWFTMSIDNDQLIQANFFTSFQQLDVNNLDEFKQPIAVETSTLLQSSLVQVKIPLKRYSLVILNGPARHRWKHAITRKDIISRRICCTFRELSSLFLDGGKQSEVGKELLNAASTFNGTVVL